MIENSYRFKKVTVHKAALKAKKEAMKMLLLNTCIYFDKCQIQNCETDHQKFFNNKKLKELKKRRNTNKKVVTRKRLIEF